MPVSGATGEIFISRSNEYPVEINTNSTISSIHAENGEKYVSEFQNVRSGTQNNEVLISLILLCTTFGEIADDPGYMERISHAEPPGE